MYACDLLTENKIYFSPRVPDLLVIKREECGGKLKIHVASPVRIFHFGEFKKFFNSIAKNYPNIEDQHAPYVTDHKNVMFGHLSLKILKQDVEIIVYPDSEIANWAISKKNEIGIPYSSFVPNDLWSQLQALFI